MDTLTGMAVFARVAEAQSFTAAAARLGMSKSAVSKAIAGLEDRLGARLLNRTTRRLSLTEVGRAFYERSARILAEAEEAELAVTCRRRRAARSRSTPRSASASCISARRSPTSWRAIPSSRSRSSSPTASST
jgi:DNA-binding transcriptional LysR family regulator